MEKITEVLENIYDSFKNRLKNPFIGTLTISWLVINWKPVYFILFSEKNIEYKIDYVSMCFTNYWMILFWPFASTTFYMLAVPYINLYFEKAVKYSNSERNEIKKKGRVAEIIHEGDVLVAEIDRDRKRLDAMDANNSAEAVENAQKQIDKITELYNNEKDKLSDMQSGYLDQIKGIEDRNKDIIMVLQNELENARKDVSIMKSENNQIAGDIESLSDRLEAEKRDSAKWESEFNKLYDEHEKTKFQLALNIFVSQRIKIGVTNLYIIIDTKSRILEYFDDNNDITYFDVDKGEVISVSDFFRLYNTQVLYLEDTPAERRNAIEIYENYKSSHM